MKHIHLGHSKSVPKHLVHHLQHYGVPVHMLRHGGAMGFVGMPTRAMYTGHGIGSPMKKDVGSMKSINGAGHKHHKKLTPLRFKL